MKLPVKFRITEKRILLAVLITLAGICVFLRFRSEEHFEGWFLAVPDRGQFWFLFADGALNINITVYPSDYGGMNGFISKPMKDIVTPVSADPDFDPGAFDIGFIPEFNPKFDLKFSLFAWITIPFSFLIGFFSVIFLLILFIKPKRWRECISPESKAP